MMCMPHRYSQSTTIEGCTSLAQVKDCIIIYVAGFYWGKLKGSISMPDIPDPIVWGWVYAIVRLEPHWTNRICDYKAMEDKLTFFLKQRCEHRPIILRQFCQYRQGASPELIKKDGGYVQAKDPL